MNFLNQIAQHGSLQQRARQTYRKTDVKTAFIEQAKRQIEGIEGGKLAKGHWFRRSTSGKYVVQLKNGATALKLDGNCCEVHCADAQAAVSVLQLAIKAAEAGEFDALLESTKIVRKKRNVAEVA